MGYQIVTPEEELKVESLVGVIFGQPGIGKTSLGFTAEKPLLEDFDEGVKRAVGRKAFLKMDTWVDVIEFHSSNEFEKIAPKTIIFDTAGSMLDNYIADYVKELDYLNKRRGGEISLQGYGAMKSVFRQFVDDMKKRKINLIFIAHTQTFQDGDAVKYRPKMTGGSYDILMGAADFVCYMESVNDKRTLNFNPTDRHVGKNTAEFDVLQVPHYTSSNWNNYLGDLIFKTKEKMESLTAEQEEALKKMDTIRDTISGMNSFEEIEEIITFIDSQKTILKVQGKKLLHERIKAITEELLADVKNAEQANELIEKLNHIPKVNQRAAKKLVFDAAGKIGIEANKELGKFVDKVKKKEPPQEDQNEKPQETLFKQSEETLG